MTLTRRLAAFVLLSATISFGQAAPAPAPQREVRPDAVRWTQSAAEYRMLSESMYLLARHQLDRALRNRAWTAAIEQQVRFRALRPAIVLDIDETVLDNSTYQAELAANGTTFTTDSFDAFCARAESRAVPGAVQFLKYVHDRGVEIFFVSNRSADLKDATVKNLRTVGIPTDADHVMLLGENGWTADKSVRRTSIAKKHRIVLLFGDDLNDFVTVQGKSSEERFAMACDHHDWWGKRWIVVPDAMYGSWDTASRRAPNGRIANSCGDLKAASASAQ